MNDELMTVPEVASLIRKPEGTLRYWRSIGRGPRSFRSGSTVVYWRSHVTAWLAEQEQATARGAES